MAHSLLGGAAAAAHAIGKQAPGIGFAVHEFGPPSRKVRFHGQRLMLPAQDRGGLAGKSDRICQSMNWSLRAHLRSPNWHPKQEQARCRPALRDRASRSAIALRRRHEKRCMAAAYSPSPVTRHLRSAAKRPRGCAEIATQVSLRQQGIVAAGKIRLHSGQPPLGAAQDHRHIIEAAWQSTSCSRLIPVWRLPAQDRIRATPDGKASTPFWSPPTVGQGGAETMSIGTDTGLETRECDRLGEIQRHSQPR